MSQPADAPAAAVAYDEDHADLEALAAEAAAAIAKVEEEQAARRAAAEQIDAAFDLELDALVADRRLNGSPAYADTAQHVIDDLCAVRTDRIDDTCEPQTGRRAT